MKWCLVWMRSIYWALNQLQRIPFFNINIEISINKFRKTTGKEIVDIRHKDNRYRSTVLLLGDRKTSNLPLGNSPHQYLILQAVLQLLFRREDAKYFTVNHFRQRAQKWIYSSWTFLPWNTTTPSWQETLWGIEITTTCSDIEAIVYDAPCSSESL